VKPVLWIEDLARVEYREMFAAVFRDGRYNLSVAVDASEAIQRVLKHTYDAVIIDIRLPPGDDEEWMRLYDKSGASEEAAKLGKHLVQSILGVQGAKVALPADEIPGWIDSTKLGFLTVEPWDDLKADFEPLGIVRETYVEKGPVNNRDALLKLIEKVLRRSHP